MTGQGVIGRTCRWCALPATGEVEVQPAQLRSVGRRDPVTGKRVTQQVFVRAAIVVPVCDDHKHITREQPAPVKLPRQSKARNVEQLDMFASTDHERPRNAIDRETGR